MKTEKLSYSNIQDFLNKTDLSSLPTFNISILRNIVVEPIEPYLRYFAYRIGFKVEVRFGRYDNILQEVLHGRDDLLGKDTGCVIVFMHLDTLSDSLTRNYNGLSAQQLHLEIDRIKKQIEIVLRGIRSHTEAAIFWHGFELPAYPATGIWDNHVHNGQIETIRGLNDFLKKEFQHTRNAYFVDINLCVSRIGHNAFYDRRYWHIARAPYSREALKEIAFEDSKFIQSITGKTKKCLVLDCDNTLWGGIIGEDGLAGIKLGKTYPGSEFYEFQKEILNLHNRGIILALCSKNNEDDVMEVFRKHPDMVLKAEHISAARINWQDKTSNIRQVAMDLNIGLDSIVFVDESEFETDLIRHELPEVEVITLPKNQAFEYKDILASCGLFDTLTISEEDKKRGAMYKVEKDRKHLSTQIVDVESYYKSLKMVVSFNFADAISIPRIAQLTQKTNQFNLTTKRYNESDIRHFINNSDTDVFYLKLTDKFGDSGIVGLCILKYENEKATIDTFLLSCRVLGRGVEDVFLVEVLKLAKTRGCKSIVGHYFKTKKNGQVEFFYSQRRFSEIEPGPGKEKDKDKRIFHYDLSQGFPSVPGHFSCVKSLPK